MVIFTLMIDPEQGRYIAFGTDGEVANPTDKLPRVMLAISHQSREAAVGALVMTHPDIHVEFVLDVPTSEER